MVVLATAGVIIIRALKNWHRRCTSLRPVSFLCRGSSKLKPVETNTAGIFPAGACQAPKDIPETVASASGAAVKTVALLSQPTLVREPLVAVVNRCALPLFSTCVGCFMCQTICPYNAIERERKKDRRTGQYQDRCSKKQSGTLSGCNVRIVLPFQVNRYTRLHQRRDVCRGNSLVEQINHRNHGRKQ